VKINKENFEKLGIKNWTSFVDPRQMFSYLESIASEHLNEKGKVISVRITRFELSQQGIIIWIDYSLNNNTILVKATSEFLLVNDELFHVKSIK